MDLSASSLRVTCAPISRQRAFSAASMVMTLRPCFCMAFRADSSSRWMLASMRAPAAAKALLTMAWSAGASRAHAFWSSTMKATTYDNGRSSMYLGLPCHCSATVPDGVLATVSTRPVCRLVNTSPIGSGIGVTPPLRKVTSAMVSPCGIHSLDLTISVRECTGRALMT